MRNIYAVTHAESVHHVEGLGGGWYDTSLTGKGITQAGKIGAALYKQINARGIPIYSSDLKRASETADEIAKVFGSRVITDKRLREMCYGDAEGKPLEWQAGNIIPLESDTDRLAYRRFDNGESREEVGTRIQSFLDEILDKPDENIIIVTHGFALTFVIMAWMKVPVENMDYCNFRSGPGRVTHLYEDDTFGNRNVGYVNQDIVSNDRP